jgi:hypothetical protein
MLQIKHENHFIPQLYLKNWGDGKKRVWSYRLLVPNKKFPNWQHSSISGIAFQRDLYTVISNGQEDDSFERWIEAEFETPVAESLLKVSKDKKLDNIDWTRLALFLAAQDVRTPTSYFESIERWNKELPALLENTLQKTIERFEETFREGKSLPASSPTENYGLFKDTLEVSAIKSDSDSNNSEIRANVTVGRKLWIESQRFLLTKTSKALLKHKWSIVEPANGMSWFTSDHPVLRLNYYGEGKYDLKGGWGRKGGNLIMPLSPKHLLYTQIGAEASDRLTFSPEKTYEIQKFLAERAFRYIFTQKQMPGVLRLRHRYVNLEEFENEEQQWSKWHAQQSSVEK